MAKNIGALWLKTSKDGELFYSGVLRDMRGDIPIVVFQNNRKEKENQPDYNIVLSEPRKEDPSRGDTGDGAQEEITI